MDIKQIVDKCGKSKADIAREMETSPSYITQLVSGKPEPTLRKLQQLADIIGCKRWEFFIDEMDIDDVARAFGLVRPSQTEQQTIHLDKIGDMPIIPCPVPPEKPEKPATQAVQQAIVCPHCGGAMAITVTPCQQE